MSEGEVAVITGATAGIGRACAKGLAAAGYRVAICGRREEQLREVERESGAALAQVCDVSDYESVAQLFAAVREKLGRVDVVFNNAGRFAPRANVGDIDVEVWRDVVATNLNGAFYVAREAFRAMREQNPQGGRIQKEMPIDASNVMLVDPTTGQPTRVGVRYLPDGSKELYAKKSGTRLRLLSKPNPKYAAKK